MLIFSSNSMPSMFLLSHVGLFLTPWTVAHQGPLSMGLSTKEYWSRLPFPSPGDLPNPGIETGSVVIQFSQFSCSVVSNSLQPQGLQHARVPSPSPTPRACSNSCPLSQWCHPTISSSAVPFSSHLQFFPGSGSFQMSQFFASRCQSIGVSASASVLPMNTQDWSPLGWTGWTSLQSEGLSRVFSSTTVQKHQFFGAQLFFIVQLSHPYMTTGKTMALTRRTFVGKVTSLLFNMLSRLVITFLARSKCLLISWLHLDQSFTNYDYVVTFYLPPIFINKVLLRHGDTHLFMNCLWLLSRYRGRVE